MVDWDIRSVEGKVSYEASRWQSQDALLDIEEVRTLFAALPPFCLYLTAGKEHLPEEDDKEEWLDIYRKYQAGLMQGSREKESRLSAFIADSAMSLYALMTPSKKILIRPKAPVLQVGVHAFYFNQEEEAFHSQIYGADSISWGIHAAFPLLFEDPETKEVKKLTDPAACPSLALYKSWQRWMREETTPVTFLCKDKKIIAPFRIGRKAKLWAKDLPRLREQGLFII
jgi:hypothetical protein